MKPAELSNFESEARRLRYRALGQACRDKQISSLLLAHHSDDQAETVFLRLTKGQKGWRMKGMQSSAEIPECWGLHGVHQSGTQMTNPFLRSVSRSDSSHGDQGRPQTISSHQTESTRFTVDLEDGGIKIYRPLLRFGKDQLRTTCLHHGVPWVEDETNQDPTKTPRNAVRQLLNSGKLPKALQKRSLIAAAERAQEKKLNRISDVEIWFRRTQILVFDVRSGVLVVRIPARAIPTTRTSKVYRGREINLFRFVASLFIRRLLDFVSARETISLQQLEFAVNSIYPDLDNPEATVVDKRLQASKFTAGGVRFERLESPIERHDRNDVNKTEKPKQHLDPDFVWLLSRQLEYNKSSILLPASSPPLSIANPEIPPQSSLSFSPWHLFDGRYWIRLAHTSPQLIQIRFPKPADMEALQDAFSSSEPLRYKQRLHCNRILKGAAPGKIRYTLPVIAEAGEGGRMLAIPTLEIALPGVLREMGLRWEVRYKKVNWGSKGVRGRDLQLRMRNGSGGERNLLMGYQKNERKQATGMKGPEK